MKRTTKPRTKPRPVPKLSRPATTNLSADTADQMISRLRAVGLSEAAYIRRLIEVDLGIIVEYVED